MNLYLLKRTDGVGWDDYRGMVVAADSEEDARKLHPAVLDLSEHYPDKQHAETSMNEYFLDTRSSRRQWGWVALDQVSTLTVALIGTSVYTEARVILTDFNAG